MQKIKVLSLFDGASMGAIALLNIDMDFEYHAIEIDQTARLVSTHSLNGIKRVENDVMKITRDLVKKLGPFDLLIAGPPCTTFSVAGKQKGDFTLLKQTMKILKWAKEFNPEVKYIIENVKMKGELLNGFEKIVGHKGVLINSELVSAQARERHYFTNLKENLPLPEEKEIDVRSIIDLGHAPISALNICELTNRARVKYYTMKDGEIFNYSSSGRGKNGVEGRFSIAKKALTVTATGYSRRALTGVRVLNGYRNLTTRELARLQGFPDRYDFSVISERQSQKIIGNGFQINVIEHILKELFK